MKRKQRRKQKLYGLLMIVASLFFSWQFKGLGYENWFLILAGIIPGIYAIFTRETMFI